MALALASECIGSGPPLVVLHGLFGSCANWRSVARALAGGHTVHAVDLRNHGASPWAGTMGYLEMADDVRRYIEDRQLDRPAVLGHSMGGKTAMALALRYPALVGRLIVADIAPVSYADTLTPVAAAMAAPEVLAATSRAEVQRRLQSRLPDPAVAPFLLQNLVARDGRFEWRINLPVIAASIGTLAGFPAELQPLRFDRPLTVIVGARSDYVTGRDGAAFAPMFPRVHVAVIGDAGHWVHADQPQAFVAAVAGTLQPLGAESGA